MHSSDGDGAAAKKTDYKNKKGKIMTKTIEQAFEALNEIDFSEFNSAANEYENSCAHTSTDELIRNKFESEPEIYYDGDGLIYYDRAWEYAKNNPEKVDDAIQNYGLDFNGSLEDFVMRAASYAYTNDEEEEARQAFRDLKDAFEGVFDDFCDAVDEIIEALKSYPEFASEALAGYSLQDYIASEWHNSPYYEDDFLSAYFSSRVGIIEQVEALELSLTTPQALPAPGEKLGEYNGIALFYNPANAAPKKSRSL